MKKEVVKNCILTLLICICVFLFYKIWFSEKLWSSDYNFFTIIGGNSAPETDTSSTIEDILRPKKIIFSYGGNRFVSTKGDKDFEDYYSEVRTVLGGITENNSKFTDATGEEFLAAAKSASIIVDFGTVFGGEIGAFLGTYFPCEQVKDVVISFNDTALGKPVVLLRDQANGKIYKTVVDMPLSPLVESVDSHIRRTAPGNLPFAFELGFNEEKQSENSEITQDILLDANIIIDLADTSASAIDIIPVSAIDLTSAESNSLLRQFGMNKSSTKKYIETNDDILFVDSKATLKISSTGTLEYTCEADGPEIYDPYSKTALSSAVGNIFSYIRSVFRTFDVTSPELQISSNLSNLSNNTEEVTIYIDYYANSIPVMAWENGHAIAVTLKNGRLTSYKQQVCRIKTTGETLSSGNMLQAVDGLYSSLPEGSKVTVSDLFVAYTKENKLSWCARLSGFEELFVINREGI